MARKIDAASVPPQRPGRSFLDADYTPAEIAIAQATGIATLGCSEVIGDDLGISGRAVRFFSQIEEKRPGPAFRFWLFQEAILRRQSDRQAALAILLTLCELAGLRVYDAAGSVDDGPLTLLVVNRRVAHLTAAFGGFLQSLDASLEDQTISKKECAGLRKALRELVRQAGLIDERLEAAHAGGMR